MAEEFIADVGYVVVERRNYEQVRTLTGDSRVPTFSDLQVHIRPASAITGYFGHISKPLTLHMSDGRKLDFWVATSSGDCKATGGFH